MVAPAAAEEEPDFVHPYERGTGFARANALDACVLAELEKRGIEPANPCSRRGLRPPRLSWTSSARCRSPRRSRRFLLDRDPDKRARLIDALLEREEFADYWALKWCDLLRVKAEFPINLWPNAVQAYHRWIRDAVQDEHAVRPVRPRAADLERQQLPRAAGQLLPRGPEPRAGGASPRPSP